MHAGQGKKGEPGLAEQEGVYFAIPLSVDEKL